MSFQDGAARNRARRQSSSNNAAAINAYAGGSASGTFVTSS
jgi:hypothetical protein